MSEANLDTTAVQRPGAFFGHITQNVRNLANEYFSTAQKGLTLDVGCGNGLFFASLPKPTGKLVGTDLDLSLLYESKQIFKDNEVANVSLVQGNVTTMPFEDKSFDAYLSARRTYLCRHPKCRQPHLKISLLAP